MLKDWSRQGTRRSLLAVPVAATLATAASPRQAAAAGPDGGASRLQATPEGRPLPENPGFQDAEGREMRFESLRGRGLVVNFWATWCPPCVVEMPSLDRAHAALARDGIEVLAVSNDRAGRTVVEPFWQRTGLRHMGMWFDRGGALGRSLGVRVLPTTIILDRRGLEVARLAGDAEWDHPEMLAAIRRLVRVTPPANTNTST